MPDNTPTARIRRIITEAAALRDQLQLLRNTISYNNPDLAAGLPPAIKTPAIDYEISYQRIVGPRVLANRQYAAAARRKWAEAVGVVESTAPPAEEPLPVLKPIETPSETPVTSNLSIDITGTREEVFSRGDPPNAEELRRLALKEDLSTPAPKKD